MSTEIIPKPDSPLESFPEEPDYGPSPANKEVKIISITLTFDQIKEFFKRLFK